MDLSKFHVVTAISNPIRYRSRYRLYERFYKHMQASGVQLWTAEAAFGRRPFVATALNEAHALRLRTEDEIWHKENLLNLIVQTLPRDWKYVAWIDADIEFLSPTWAEETWHQLQHYHWVQLFQSAIDLGPSGQVLHTHKGFAWSYLNQETFTRQYGGWHPGYAWACTRDAWNAVGGLLDIGVLGAGDDHMAKSIIGRGKDSVPDGLSEGYLDRVLAWEKHAKALKTDMGFVPGTIRHFWHGKKSNRKYWTRWDIFKKWQFDPTVDLKKDWQGLYMLTDGKPAMRDAIRAYFRHRNEDGIDLD